MESPDEGAAAGSPVEAPVAQESLGHAEDAYMDVTAAAPVQHPAENGVEHHEDVSMKRRPDEDDEAMESQSQCVGAAYRCSGNPVLTRDASVALISDILSAKKMRTEEMEPESSQSAAQETPLSAEAPTDVPSQVCIA
jgi:phage-related tail fiber protein